MSMAKQGHFQYVAEYVKFAVALHARSTLRPILRSPSFPSAHSKHQNIYTKSIISVQRISFKCVISFYVARAHSALSANANIFAKFAFCRRKKENSFGFVNRLKAWILSVL